eukprot:TRINITY_DN10784_c0_g1_i1.p1 TRINITY_DN10784_c0_g1~~TRINITY_DN10784_c0_g1_i1.p1  ORF type:complete len:283 (-),score=38.86 TRINITY_DN10784_c0_g1_i1:199-930(-)
MAVIYSSLALVVWKKHQHRLGDALLTYGDSRLPLLCHNAALPYDVVMDQSWTPRRCIVQNGFVEGEWYENEITRHLGNQNSLSSARRSRLQDLLQRRPTFADPFAGQSPSIGTEGGTSSSPLVQSIFPTAIAPTAENNRTRAGSGSSVSPLQIEQPAGNSSASISPRHQRRGSDEQESDSFPSQRSSINSVPEDAQPPQAAEGQAPAAAAIAATTAPEATAPVAATAAATVTTDTTVTTATLR